MILRLIKTIIELERMRIESCFFVQYIITQRGDVLTLMIPSLNDPLGLRKLQMMVSRLRRNLPKANKAERGEKIEEKMAWHANRTSHFDREGGER